MIYFCHLFNSSLCGDELSCAGRYLDLGRRVAFVDFRDYGGGNVIFGGGGILARGFDSAYQRALANPDVFKAIWGAGLNYAANYGVEYPKWLDQFDLVGLRDYANPYHYVPCPSCLHPIFDSCSTNDLIGPVFFCHPGRPVPLQPEEFAGWIEYPRWFGFEQAIAKLSKATVVVTNSFHGCYYAMLLGKPVVVINEEAVAFRTLKYLPVICNPKDWKSAAETAKPGSQWYLNECRRINLDFRDRIVGMLDARKNYKIHL